MSPRSSDEAAAKERRELHPEISKRQKRVLFERGLALFDRGRYFEAHEPWEEIWRSSDPEPRDLFQGLVQVAAGMHIWHQRGRAPAARRVLARGHARLSLVADRAEVLAGAPAVRATQQGHWRRLKLDSSVKIQPPPVEPAAFTRSIPGLLEQLAPWLDWLEHPDGAPPPAPRLGAEGPERYVR